MTDTAESPTLNTELLQRTLARIEADPAHWNQDVWAERAPECGTRYCFAGWAVALALPEAEFQWGAKCVGDLYRPPFDGEGADRVALPDGAVRSVHAVAADLLGLDHEQASELFYSQRADTLDGLRRVVGEIIAPS